MMHFVLDLRNYTYILLNAESSVDLLASLINIFYTVSLIFFTWGTHSWKIVLSSYHPCILPTFLTYKWYMLKIFCDCSVPNSILTCEGHHTYCFHENNNKTLCFTCSVDHCTSNGKQVDVSRLSDKLWSTNIWYKIDKAMSNLKNATKRKYGWIF